MLRELLGAVGLAALPALLAAQAPAAKPVPAHGVATEVRGEVVVAHDAEGPNNQVGVDEADGDNNQEGVNEPDGDNNQEGIQEANGENTDGAIGEGGVGEQDGANNDGNDIGDQTGQEQGSASVPNEGEVSRIGRHRP